MEELKIIQNKNDIIINNVLYYDAGSFITCCNEIENLENKVSITTKYELKNDKEKFHLKFVDSNGNEQEFLRTSGCYGCLEYNTKQLNDEQVYFIIQKLKKENYIDTNYDFHSINYNNKKNLITIEDNYKIIKIYCNDFQKDLYYYVNDYCKEIKCETLKFRIVNFGKIKEKQYDKFGVSIISDTKEHIFSTNNKKIKIKEYIKEI